MYRGVFPAGGYQLIVRTSLNNFTVCEHEDLISVFYRTDPVSDDKSQ